MKFKRSETIATLSKEYKPGGGKGLLISLGVFAVLFFVPFFFYPVTISVALYNLLKSSDKKVKTIYGLTIGFLVITMCLWLCLGITWLIAYKFNL